MKFYNPFKPHIVEFKDGTYGIRKYDSLFALIFSDPWFLSDVLDYWYGYKFTRNCKFDNKGKALLRLINMTDGYDKGKIV